MNACDAYKFDIKAGHYPMCPSHPDIAICVCKELAEQRGELMTPKCTCGTPLLNEHAETCPDYVPRFHPRTSDEPRECEKCGVDVEQVSPQCGEPHGISAAARYDRELPELQRQAMAKIVDAATRCITCGTIGHDSDFHESTLAVDPRMRPILTAVLAEVERKEAGMPASVASWRTILYDIYVGAAARAIIKAKRVKSAPHRKEK